MLPTARPTPRDNKAPNGDRETPLYQQVLGNRWIDLPPALRHMHDLRGSMVARGTASIETGRGMAGLVRRVFGFPEAAGSVPIQMTFSRNGDAETWTRQFGSSIFSSVQRLARHGEGLVERFGFFSVILRPVLTGGRLNLVVRGWRLLGMPLPLPPGGTTYEFESDNRFHFHVEITHPWLGLIVAYSGALDAPEPAGP